MTLEPTRIVGSTDTKEIIAGQDRTIRVDLTEYYTKQPVDLTGITAATAQFGNADGSTLTLSLAGGDIAVDASNRVLSITLSAARSALLAVGDTQSWEVSVTIAGKTTIVQFIEQLAVRAQVY
jgi:hypothetical protein